MSQSNSESGTFSASEQSDVEIVYPSLDYYESALISMGIGPSYSTITWTLCTDESAHSVSQSHPWTQLLLPHRDRLLLYLFGSKSMLYFPS